jgi:hypothetical protein
MSEPAAKIKVEMVKDGKDGMWGWFRGGGGTVVAGAEEACGRDRRYEVVLGVLLNELKFDMIYSKDKELRYVRHTV